MQDDPQARSDSGTDLGTADTRIERLRPGRARRTVILTYSNTATSLAIQRNLTTHTLGVQRAMERLSSGLRINRAADDPSGLAIAERLRARERSSMQAIRNANDGISMLQIAEGAMGEVSSLLIRLRELALQSANGTLGDAERAILDLEAQGLIEEISRIAQVTDFNGVNLLNGSTGTLVLQTGSASGDTLDVTGVDVRSSQLGTTDVLSNLDIASQAASLSAVTVLDEAIDQVSQARGDLGTQQQRLESRIRSLSVSVENTAAARSRIMDADIAVEMANLARSQVMQQVSLAMLAQANLQQRVVLQLLESSFR